MLKRCKLGFLAQIHTSTESPHYCLLDFITFKPLWDIYTMLGGEWREALYLFLSSQKDTHTRRQISCHGALQWISVLTRVIAFLLGRLWVLIRLDKVCSPVRVIFICTPDCAASARTASAPRPHLSPGRRGGQHPLRIKWLYQLLWEKKSQSCRYWDKFPSPKVGKIRSLVNLF